MNDKTLSIVIKAQDKASKVMASVGDKMEEISNKVAAAAKVAAVAVAAMAVAFSVNAVKSAIDLGESINAVQKTFGDASKKILEFGKVAAEQAGLSASAFNTAVTPIGAALRNVGFSADEAADSSIELGKRAADLASVFNTSLDDALTSIQAGLRGEADPLEKFGVGLSQTNVEAYALAQGIINVDEKMTPLQASTARMGLFLEQTNRFAGDFVETSDQAANKARILTARFENQSAVIGEKLLPVWELILDTGDKLITNVFPVISDLVDRASNAFNKLWPAVVAVATQVGNYLGPKLAALGAVILEDVIPPLLDLWHNVIEPLLPVIGQTLVAAIGLAIDAFAFIVSGIANLVRGFQEGNPIILGLAAVFGTLAAAMAFNAVFNALSVGFATMTLITIPSVMASIGALRALVLAPIVMPAIAVGLAIAAMVSVYNAAKKAMDAIDGANRAQAESTQQSSNDIQRQNLIINDPNSSAEQVTQARKARGVLIKYMNTGGPVRANQPYFVGDNPDGTLNSTSELFVPKTAGSIINAKTLQDAMGGGGNSSTFNMYGSIQLGSSNAVDRFFERMDSQKELGNYGVGV